MPRPHAGEDVLQQEFSFTAVEFNENKQKKKRVSWHNFFKI